MTLSPRVVTPTVSSAYPISLDQAREFCGGLEAGDPGDEALLKSAIATAFAWLQPPRGCLRVSIAPQTLRVDLPYWPKCLELPAGPVASISSVKYYDESNADQTVDPSNYFIDNDTIIFTSTFAAPSLYERPSAVRIEYVTGSTEDEPLRMAMRRIVKQLFDYRDEAISAEMRFDAEVFGVGQLIMQYRQR